MDKAITEAFSALLGAIFGFGFFVWILGLLFTLAFVALVVLVVKKIWYWKPNKKKDTRRTRSNDWYEEAQYRQSKRYEYTDPVIPTKSTPKAKEPKWYPSGWVYNEETGLWDPPDYLIVEAQKRWKWDDEKGIWIDLDKERRLERYRKAHEGREPTYEEWKAAKLKKQQEEQEHPED